MIHMHVYLLYEASRKWHHHHTFSQVYGLITSVI